MDVRPGRTFSVLPPRLSELAGERVGTICSTLTLLSEEDVIYILFVLHACAVDQLYALMNHGYTQSGRVWENMIPMKAGQSKSI